MESRFSEELTRLERLSVAELQSHYRQVWGEGTRNRHRVWLIRRILWRQQALAEGDLSQRARARATELANDADLRVLAPRAPRVHATLVRAPAKSVDRRLPPPGAVIVRDYKGQRLQVEVLPQGFRFDGRDYASLSAVAKAITGSHCNGFYFFRLAGGRAS